MQRKDIFLHLPFTLKQRNTTVGCLITSFCLLPNYDKFYLIMKHTSFKLHIQTPGKEIKLTKTVFHFLSQLGQNSKFSLWGEIFQLYLLVQLAVDAKPFLLLADAYLPLSLPVLSSRPWSHSPVNRLRPSLVSCQFPSATMATQLHG